MTRTAEKVIWKDESYAIIGACFAVYKDKGRGFLEPVYHECLEIEFDWQRIPFLSKPPQTLQYRGRTLVQTFTPDFICYDEIVVEIKAVSTLIDELSQRHRLRARSSRELWSLSRDGIRAPRH